MASQGPNSPGTAAIDSSVGVISWGNYTGANAPGGIAAYLSTTSTSYRKSYYLKCSNFGFSIPAGATINGLIVEIKKNKDADKVLSAIDDEIKIIKSDGSIGTLNKADTSTEWPTTYQYIQYGTGSDLWGESWGASDINDVDFGIAISGKIKKITAKSNVTCNVDHIRITVYYTEGSSAAVKSIGGIVVANIKSVIGTVIGNVKSYFGIAK